MRNSARQPERIFEETGPLDELLNRATLSILAGIDPIVAAEYMRTQPDLPRAAAIEIVAKLLAEGSARQERGATRGNQGLDVARAYLLWGQLLHDAGARDEAVKAFDRADQEYRRVHANSPGWAVALDLKGWTLQTVGNGPTACQ